MRLLFIKQSLWWPRSRGHDVHGFFMMQALARLGHEVRLLLVERPDPRATADLDAELTVLAERRGAAMELPRRLQRRFVSYWGVSKADLETVRGLTSLWRPDAAIAIGPEVLPFLAAAVSTHRVWYAADDLCWQHLTQIRSVSGGALRNLREAMIAAAYERAFANAVDRVWMVSDADARAVRWLGGASRVDVVPNGVDTSYFHPAAVAERADSAMFWGNLGFAPNVEAVRWFCEEVWPIVRQRRSQATLTLAGYAPSPAVQHFAGRDGIRVAGPVADLRGEVSQHQIAVMPFRSGSGLKNKMLEAAAMGRTTVCTRTAMNGLRGDADAAFVVADRPAEWANRIEALWDDPSARAALGTRARRWVEANHTWQRAAQDALRTLQC